MSGDAPTSGTDAVPDRARVLARFERSWSDLRTVIDEREERHLIAPGDGGWSARDHLDHVAAWEECALMQLNGRNWLAELELPAGADEDVENEALRRRHAQLSLSDVRRFMEESHARLIARIGAMSEAELAAPRPGGGGQSVAQWMISYAEHIDEHRAYIEALA